MKIANWGMLYAAADFIYANTTADERKTLFSQTEKSRDEKGLTDHNLQYIGKKHFYKKMFKKIKKSF